MLVKWIAFDSGDSNWLFCNVFVCSPLYSESALPIPHEFDNVCVCSFCTYLRFGCKQKKATLRLLTRMILSWVKTCHFALSVFQWSDSPVLTGRDIMSCNNQTILATFNFCYALTGEQRRRLLLENRQFMLCLRPFRTKVFMMTFKFVNCCHHFVVRR